MKKCIILIGPPCSGKSTYSESLGNDSNFFILSCDRIRSVYTKNEKVVWAYFYSEVERYCLFGFDFIIDNTNCKESYINEILKRIPKDYIVEYKLFDVPLYKLYYRNIIRYISTGKWIPFKVIKDIKQRFDKIKHKYETK
jgi:predicted kinase